MNPLDCTSLMSCGEGGGGLLGGMLPMILILVVMVVVMIIPQRRKDKKVKDMLSNLKPGDRVRTIGGIYGTIKNMKEDVVTIATGPDQVLLVFARGAISQVEDKGVEQSLDEKVK
ncbi:MAG: preprotein translocase subunit YajC [Clostridiales bacterium]|nr:preprotein translocase subunit YajC [Clostridiales bacterium]